MSKISSPIWCNDLWYYQKGCDGGDLIACKNLGLMFEDGRGVSRDHKKAVELYQKACDGGNANSCANLGVMFDSGRGIS